MNTALASSCLSVRTSTPCARRSTPTPAKQAATGRQIIKIIERSLPHALSETGEVRLWLTVIGLALAEADNKKQGGGARIFVNSTGFHVVCDAIGLDHDWVLELLRDHAKWLRPGFHKQGNNLEHTN